MASSRIVVECQGTRIGLEVEDPVVRSRLEGYLPPEWRAAVAPALSWFRIEKIPSSGAYLLWRGRHVLASDDNLDDVLETLESSLHFELAARASQRLFVHAGVVGWRGRVLVLPGVSRSGKTTLVAALLRAGATYFSDEYAVIDRRGWVHPYPKPLSIRIDGLLKPRRVPADTLGGRVGARPRPLGLVAALQYRPGTGWSPRQGGAGEALLALLGHTVVARARPRFALRVLSAAVSGVPCLTGDRGAAADAAGALLEMMDRSPPLPEEVEG
jgi:hypothetical protein